METLELTSNKITSNSSADLTKGAIEAIKVITAKIKSEGWRMNNPITVNEHTLGLAIAAMSLNQRKKLKNKINGCINRQSMKSINTLLHFIHRHVYKETTPAPYVTISAKEEQIQIARKKYVEARELAIKLQAIYKAEKADFYKDKLSK